MKSKIIIIILIISLVASAYYNIKSIRENDQKEHVVFNFTNSYINDIQQGLKQLEDSYSTGNYSGLDGKVSFVVENLYSVDQLLNEASYLVSVKDFYISSLHDFQNIGYAMNGRLKDKGYQGSFDEDQVLSENEVKFIRQLSKDLDIVRSSLVGKDKLNINPNLTMGDFKNTLKVFSDKWNIYYGRAVSGFSPYDYLKVK